MPSTDAGAVSTYAETVAILALLIEAGKSINYKALSEITGERSAGVYNKRMPTLNRHAQLVVEDRKNGGKGCLQDLVPDELKASDGATASPKKRGSASSASGKSKKAKVKEEADGDAEDAADGSEGAEY